jgi:hypothetical protein
MSWTNTDELPDWMRPLRLDASEVATVAEEVRSEHGPIKGRRLLREARQIDETLIHGGLEGLIDHYSRICGLSERSVRRRLADLRTVREIRLRYTKRHDTQP